MGLAHRACYRVSQETGPQSKGLAQGLGKHRSPTSIQPQRFVGAPWAIVVVGLPLANDEIPTTVMRLQRRWAFLACSGLKIHRFQHHLSFCSL